jgi:hypothetical protein
MTGLGARVLRSIVATLPGPVRDGESGSTGGARPAETEDAPLGVPWRRGVCIIEARPTLLPPSHAMTTKTADAGPRSPRGSSFPLANTLIIAAAAAYAVYLLVARGRLDWQLDDFLTASYTLAGCLALVGPLVLLRPGVTAGNGLGDLAWLTGGLLVWVFNLANIAQGTPRPQAWVTPLSASTMGLTMLAVMLAGWRARGKGTLHWTNLTGWVLGLFWVGLGLYTILPREAIGVAAR